MIGNYSLHRTWVKFAAHLIALMLLGVVLGPRLAATDSIDVVDENGQQSTYIASRPSTFSWPTTHTASSGPNWGTTTKLALYASRAALPLTIATGLKFDGDTTGNTIVGPNRINLVTDPSGTVNVGDTLVISGCANAGNNGVFIVATKGANFLTVNASANWTTESTPGVIANINPGLIRTSVSGTTTVTVRTTTNHGLVAGSSFVVILPQNDASFSESLVQVQTTPTAKSFTFFPSIGGLDATSNAGEVHILPGPVQDAGIETQFIQEVANTGSLSRTLPNLIGTDVYYFLADEANPTERIYSTDTITVRGIQLTSPKPGDIVTANQTPSATEIRVEMVGYPVAAGSTIFTFTLSRDGLFSGGSQDEFLANLMSGASANMTATAPTIRGATAAYIFRAGATTWTAPLTPEARIKVKTLANSSINVDVTDTTGPTDGASTDPLFITVGSPGYIDRAFRIGAGTGPVPMFSPNGGEVIANVQLSGGLQIGNTSTVRYIPLGDTTLPITTIQDGMVLEFSGDSGNTWEPLSKVEYQSSSFAAAGNTINVLSGSTGPIRVGAPVVIRGSSLNDGTYVVSSVSGSSFTVVEPIVNETIPVANTPATIMVGIQIDPSSSRFVWSTTQDPTSRARLRTRLLRTAGGDLGADNGAIVNDVVDTSNADFTLRGIVWKGLTSKTMMPVGTTQTLNWVSAGSAGRVNILLSRNGGLSSTTIASNVVDNGTYDWLVTGPVSANCILQVQQADNPSLFFDSSPTFTIQGYTVVTPNGGEIFQIGSLQSVLWISAGMPVIPNAMNAVDIDLTYTDPATGTPAVLNIATGVPNSLNFPWTLANSIPGVTDARIKISNNDATLKPIGPGLSSNPFTIQRAIHITSPNGGNTFVVGEKTPVTWTTTGLPILPPSITSFIRPELMLGTLIESPANSGAIRTSNVVTVKTIAAHGFTTGDNILITDLSDPSFNGTFTITVTGANTFTYPQLGVDGNTGNGVAYKAKRVLGGSKIDSVANTGISRSAGVVSVTTITAHGYTVGDTVRVVDVADATFNGNFAVASTPTSTTFTYGQVGVNTNSGGGATYKTGPVASLAKINNGSINAVWTSDDVSDLARVRVLEVNGSNVPQPLATAFTNDVSDSAFAIKTFVSEPEAISVTAPNGGESFILGQSVPITWTSSGQVTRSNTVTIRLTRDTTDNNGENVVLATNVANTGSFTWLVVGAPTNHARIVVTSDADSNVTDVSDGDFIVKGIQVLTPNALSDSVTVGAPLSITWNFGFTTASDNVKIEISRDGGTTFSTISASTPNNGGFLWVSQQPVSASCKVRITSLGDASLTDSSDVTFQLRGLSVTSPTGGETWNQGTLQNVTWNSVGAGNFVNVDVSLDGGKSFQRIATHTNNNGSVVWTVAQPFNGTRTVRAVTISAGTNTITFAPGTDLTGIAAGDRLVSTSALNAGTFTVATVNVAGPSLTCSNTLVNEVPNKDVTIQLAAVSQTPAFSVTRTLKTVSFSAATSTITFLASSNMTGLQVGDTVKVTGTASNDGTYKIATIVGNTVTVTTPLVLEAVAVDATVNLQLQPTRTLRTVSFDGSNSTINFTAGTILSGVAAGQTITIGSPSVNAGVYTIASVGTSSLVVTGTLSNEVLAVDGTIVNAATTAYYINTPSANALLRITDSASSIFQDVSDAVFTIPPATPTLLTFAALPNAQPPFQFGTATQLQWNGQGLGATATLELSTDSGATFTLVDAAVPNNTSTATSTYIWTAPNIATTNAVLRLKSNVSPNPSVLTTGVFSITAPTVPSLLETPSAPTPIAFTAIESGDNPADQTGTVKNIGSLSTTYTLTVPGAASAWLQIALQPSSGSPVFGSSVTNTLAANASDTIIFHATVGSLPPGLTTASVALTATGGALGQVPFTVNFTITAAGIGILSTNPIVIQLPEGSQTTSVITIQNRTTGTITPGVSGVPSWASMSAFSPVTIAAGGSGSSTLTVNANGLTPGLYTATILVDNAGGDPKRTITIQFTVKAAKISFENKKKSCSIGGVQDAAGVAGFVLPFAVLALIWLVQRRRAIQPRFSESTSRLSGLLLVAALVLLAGAAPRAQAATIGSAEEGPSLFGLDVHVPVMLHAIDYNEIYGLTVVNENVPLQDANFGGAILSSAWVNQNPRGWLPRNMLAELQLGLIGGSGIANIQNLFGISTTRYDARIFNGRMLFAVPLHLDLDEGQRRDDRRPTALNFLATVGYHYIVVDFDKTSVNELGRGAEVGAGFSGEYGLNPTVVAFASVMAVGRFQTYNNAFKDSKFNSSVEGQVAVGLGWNFTAHWEMQLQATGVISELTDFHRFGGMLSFRYGTSGAQ